MLKIDFYCQSTETLFIRDLFIKKWQGKTLTEICDLIKNINTIEYYDFPEYAIDMNGHKYKLGLANYLILSKNKYEWAQRVYKWLNGNLSWQGAQSYLNFTNRQRELEIELLNKKILEGSLNGKLSEPYLLDIAEDYLKSKGFKTRREVKVKYGRIDLYAKNKDREMVIEGKSFNSINHVSRGLGQLLLYKNCYPKSELYLLTQEPPSEEVLEVLNLYGVKWFNNNVV